MHPSSITTRRACKTAPPASAALRLLPSTCLTAAATLLIGLSGCAETTPELDARYGDAVRNLRAQQTLDPQAGERNALRPMVLDGKAARAVMDNYRDSYRVPPSEARSPQTVIGIGSGAGQ